jgi:hypothetical protein
MQLLDKLCYQDDGVVGYAAVELGINIPKQPASSVLRHIIFIERSSNKTQTALP